MSIRTPPNLPAAVIRILKPLASILLRHGVSYMTFAELAKWVYVDTALREFGIPGRKPSVSRVAIITGLSRKEVMRVRGLPRPTDQESAERYNRAVRVITAWRQEPDFRDEHGKPALLPFSGGEKTFNELVRRFSGDVPARAVLDELKRVDAVRELEDGRIQLCAEAYVPRALESEKIHILGTDVGYLISTIDHNLRPDLEPPFFQRRVSYDNLPDQALPKFRKRTVRKAQALLENMAAWLAKHDRDTNPAVTGTVRNRAGVGIYYFEGPHSEEDP
ncbi:MAG: hypothetical protein HXY45_10890 [Syntrophaceae bacterium]|nr:hypothetical protein [Syntrophaceae bacterium]